MGCVKSTAVAGIVRGNINVPGRDEEKTETTTDPGIPATRLPTSEATIAF